MPLKRKKQVTIAMIAEHANVSRVAVYAALNPQKKTTVCISDATRQKIQDTAKELGYVPNDMARTLVSGQSRNIGLLLQSNASRFSQLLMSECSRKFGADNYMVIPDASQYSVAREREILSSFLIKRVDCVMIGRLSYEENKDLLEQFERCGIPMIHLQNQVAEYENSANLCFDEEAVMTILCDYFLRIGKRRIGYVGFKGLHNFVSVKRYEFLRDAVAARPALQLQVPYFAASAEDCEEYAGNVARCTERPEAVICFNDQLAQAVGVGLRFAGISIPRDLILAGVDGYGDPFDSIPQLSVRLPVEKLAEAAYKLFTGGDFHRQIIKISPELVEFK